MIKRTLYFGNPAYLSCKNEQMEISLPEAVAIARGVASEKSGAFPVSATVPIEDIGIVILDHSQVTITHHLIHKLLESNVALITSDDKHLPTGLMLNLNGNTIQQERFEAQIEASVPLKKQLWAQTTVTKITNQAMVLKKYGINHENMLHWASSVKSGDSENHEARAAAYYWQHIFPDELMFTRQRDGRYPNNLLNYGYAILRGIMARSLVGSGLLPTLGIFHHNRYNAYCLADDMMEPYRPYVDLLVLDMMKKMQPTEELTKELKAQLLTVATLDVSLGGQNSPLMVATQNTAASLAKCFLGEVRRIAYPEM
jgi:CRISP-associated protein Cas1